MKSALDSNCAAVTTAMRGRSRLTPQVTGDVVTLGAGDIAALPLAGEAEVVGRLAPDVSIAEVVVEVLGVFEWLVAALPATGYQLRLFAAVARR